MSWTYRHVLRPILFQVDPERTHDLAILASEVAGQFTPVRAAMKRICQRHHPALETEAFGLRFPNPLGLAAGWDKNGRTVRLMEALGFGHVEIGSVSADPSEGNPRPRLWRLPDDQAICVHYGLPNDGAEAVARRLDASASRHPAHRSVRLGINIVKTNRGLDAPPDGEPAILDDYLRSVRVLHSRADYLCLNLSCPNTEMGRDHFADPKAIRNLLDLLGEQTLTCPVLLKVSPLGGIAAIESLLEVIESYPFVSGFAYNLAPGLPDGLKTSSAQIKHMRGAVAGKPVEEATNRRIGELYRRMDRSRYQIIGIGGVFSAEDAYAKIRQGASLVQLFTGLIYEGPGIVPRILSGLLQCLERDGFRTIGEAVGSAHAHGTYSGSLA